MGRYRWKNALLGFPNEGRRRLGRSFGRVDVDPTVNPLKRPSNLEIKVEMCRLRVSVLWA